MISEGDNLTDLVAGLPIAGSAGGVSNLKTVQALTTQDAKAAMEKANAARGAYSTPGSGS